MHELPTSEQQVDGLHAHEYGTPYLLFVPKAGGESSVCVFSHDMIMPHSLLCGISHAPHGATVVTVSPRRGSWAPGAAAPEQPAPVLQNAAVRRLSRD